VGIEVCAHAGGRRLLARIQVHEPGNVAGGELVVHAVLKGSDGSHGAVYVEQLGLVEAGRIRCVRAKRGECLSHRISFASEFIHTVEYQEDWLASTAGTSITRGPSAANVMPIRSPGPNSSSRSPSNASVPRASPT